ncbi:MAG: hypothetical protein WCG27_07855, partial [Pseudomonadota bacterium]
SYNILHHIFSPRKKIKMDFDNSFYATVFNDPAPIARLNAVQGTVEDVAAVNAVLGKVLNGTATAAQISKITMTYEETLNDPNYAFYLDLLDLIIKELEGKK